MPKEAGSFDLPIALGILIGSGQVASERLEQYAVVGELALDGCTRPAKGALSMAMAAAEQKGLRGLLVPAQSAPRPPWSKAIEVIPVASLAQAVGFLSGEIRDRADAFAARRLLPRTGGLRCGFLRRPRPGDGQAGDRRGRRRRA